MKRLMPILCGIAYFCLPLFPAFITLTAVSVPGVSLVPTSIAVVLLGVMALCAIGGVVALLTAPRERPPTFVPLLLWLGAALLAALLGFNPGGSAVFLGILGLGVIWHLAILRFYREPHVAPAIFWSFLVSGLLASIVAIVMVLLKTPGDQYTIGHGRAIGTFILPGELAGYLIVYLPTAYGVARATRSSALRALATVGFAVGLVALTMTFSRAGWVGFAAAVTFYLLATGSGRQLRYAMLPIVVGVAAVLAVFNMHHNPSENYTRLSIWQAAISIIERFPLTGVGPLNFASVYALVRLPDGDQTAFHAHSFLLTFFAESGLVGLLAFLNVWRRFVEVLRERLRGVPKAHIQLALALAAGLVGTWVQGIIDTVSVVIFGLWLPTMALVLAVARDGMAEE